MAKQGASTTVPKLRFPEFRQAAEWAQIPLSKAFLRITNGKANSQDHEEGGIYPLFDRSAVIKASSNFMFSAEAVILPGEGMAFQSRYFEGKFNLHQRAYALMDCQGHTKYFYYALDRAKDDLALKAVKSTVLSLRLPIIEKFAVYAPEKREQQKIADCLASLDDVIATQGQKVEALKAHKRGLMQQLFPREGETRPRLRFPEFRNATEWNTQPLGSLMTIGSSRRVHESDWTSSGVPFYRAREIVALSNREPISPLFISDSLYAEYVGYTGEIEEGQLLVTGVGSIGIPYLVRKFDRFYFKDGNIIWLKNGQADVLGDFLFRLFESEYVQAQIATMAGIGTVGTYTIENAKRTVAVFPSDKREQQRIADCLSSLDAEITAESNQLAALKTHKQGLMQQLFPAPEAG